AGRIGDVHPRHGPPPRLPADGPDRDGRGAAGARPLEPARPVRPRGARPAAVGGAEARRVARVHLPGRRSPDPARAHAEALGTGQVAAVAEELPPGAVAAAELRPARAGPPRPAPFARARAHRRQVPRADGVVGDTRAAHVDAGTARDPREDRRRRTRPWTAALGPRRTRVPGERDAAAA